MDVEPHSLSGKADGLRVGVVIASKGRPDELKLLLGRLREQTLLPSVIVLSLTSEADAPSGDAGGSETVFGTAGLPAQRNRGIAAAKGRCDVVVFFDDDYVPSKCAIEGLARVFGDDPDIVGATGTLLADGVTNGGVPPQDAVALVDAYDAGLAPQDQLETLFDGLYGCNMAFRMSATADLQFDEELPLYAWQEDMDFSFLVGKRGRLVKTNALVGVHCGVTKARSPGLRLGYSQIANPMYLVRKGTMRSQVALNLMVRNLIANHVKCLLPEPWIDRKGRMAGNWLALRDYVSGRLRPGRILELNPR